MTANRCRRSWVSAGTAGPKGGADEGAAGGENTEACTAGELGRVRGQRRSEGLDPGIERMPHERRTEGAGGESQRIVPLDQVSFNEDRDLLLRHQIPLENRRAEELPESMIPDRDRTCTQ